MVDPVTLGLAGAGIAGSLFGGKKQKAQPTSGFATLPKPVQDAFLKTYLPDVLSQYDAPFQAIPMNRVAAPDPNDPFASRGLYDLQQYSDSIGGLFSPTDPQKLLPQEDEPVQNREEIMSLMDFIVNKRPQQNNFVRGYNFGPKVRQQAETVGVNPSTVSFTELLEALGV